METSENLPKPVGVRISHMVMEKVIDRQSGDINEVIVDALRGAKQIGVFDAPDKTCTVFFDVDIVNEMMPDTFNAMGSAFVAAHSMGNAKTPFMFGTVLVLGPMGPDSKPTPITDEVMHECGELPDKTDEILSAKNDGIDTETQERSWIADPIGHRQHLKTLPRPDKSEFLGMEVPVIYPDVNFPDDAWICDFCNDPILIEEQLEEGDDRDPAKLMVPMFMSNAVCHTCAPKYVSDPEGKALFAEWGHKVPSTIEELASWSAACCPCPPCRIEALAFVARVGANA